LVGSIESVLFTAAVSLLDVPLVTTHFEVGVVHGLATAFGPAIVLAIQDFVSTTDVSLVVHQLLSTANPSSRNDFVIATGEIGVSGRNDVISTAGSETVEDPEGLISSVVLSYTAGLVGSVVGSGATTSISQLSGNDGLSAAEIQGRVDTIPTTTFSSHGIDKTDTASGGSTTGVSCRIEYISTTASTKAFDWSEDESLLWAILDTTSLGGQVEDANVSTATGLVRHLTFRNLENKFTTAHLLFGVESQATGSGATALKSVLLLLVLELDELTIAADSVLAVEHLSTATGIALPQSGVESISITTDLDAGVDGFLSTALKGNQEGVGAFDGFLIDEDLELSLSILLVLVVVGELFASTAKLTNARIESLSVTTRREDSFYHLVRTATVSVLEIWLSSATGITT